ncbi:hypothetical protein [Sphingomonas hengshuiensis]|uniref:Uncharacterized protein n=1 Tax=Sphingomonas hengshuiensis TaxID=1609977 RepID=A0A7U4J6M5_9SPHN|nr:hypothetical protein [Sphingomonas hengshuiensis]AJP71238.1 hypothetical protein TS85_04600 [Sphingomonas hengshuiensis]
MKAAIRFTDVSLGQPVELDERMESDSPIAERACAMVRQWAGAATASLVSMHLWDDRLAPEQVAGRVMARHLDGSNRADVEILMRAQDRCARAVVRVALG